MYNIDILIIDKGVRMTTNLFRITNAKKGEKLISFNFNVNYNTYVVNTTKARIKELERAGYIIKHDNIYQLIKL